MDVALVTAIGSFSADIVIKRLKVLGMRVVGCDIYHRELVVDAANVDQFYQAPYTSAIDEYRAFLMDVCAREKVDYILPLTDVDVDFFNAERDGDGLFAGALVCISPASALRLCRDKQAMAEFLLSSESGVRGIKTNRLVDMRSRPSTYPVVVKPLDGRSSQGLRYVHDDEEWDALFGIEEPRRYIVQPFLEGHVVCVDVVRQRDGGATVAVPRREYLRTLNGAGTSVEVFRNEKLSQSCVLLAQELGVVGCVNFEFIETCENEDYRFLECNPRFSGGVEFTCIAAYACVDNHLRAFRGEQIDALAPYHSQFIARKYEEYVTRVEA